MFDVDKFIKCIHNNNAIWETSSKQYMDKNMKTQSWVNVGQAVYEDWDELSTTEKDDRGKILYILVPILSNIYYYYHENIKYSIYTFIYTRECIHFVLTYIFKLVIIKK